MLTLLGSLLGFFSSALPKFLDIWQGRNDREHELEILDRQMEQMRLGHSQRLEEISVNADIQESLALYKHDTSIPASTWVNNLRASVRPIITYAFFLLFASVKLSALYILIINQEMHISQALIKVWDVETQALFAATLSFWFSTRSIFKRRRDN